MSTFVQTAGCIELAGIIVSSQGFPPFDIFHLLDREFLSCCQLVGIRVSEVSKKENKLSFISGLKYLYLLDISYIVISVGEIVFILMIGQLSSR